MKRRLIFLGILAAGVVGVTFAANSRPPAPAAQPTVSTVRAPAGIPDPEAQLEATARLFRANDMVGLVRAVVPPSRYEEVRAKYELHRHEPIDDAERAEFAEEVARFTAPDAVDQLMARIEPELEKARPQAPGALLMAFGAMQMAVTSPDSPLTDDQRLALQSALPGIQRWASSTDFLDSNSMRASLTLITDAARRTGLTDLDKIKALPLEGVLQHMGSVLAAAKQAVRNYGIDLDQIADSLQIDVLEIGNGTARVRATITLFDAPIWAEHELVLVEGRWYGEESAKHFDIAYQSSED